MLPVRYQWLLHLAKSRCAQHRIVVRSCRHHHSTCSSHFQWISFQKCRNVINPNVFMIGTQRSFRQTDKHRTEPDHSISAIDRNLTDDSIARLPFQTIEEVWDTFSHKVDSKEAMIPTDVVNTWVQLLQRKYANLIEIPWLERFIHVAHLQLRFSHRLDEEMVPIWQTPEMDSLCRVTRTVYRNCTNAELVDMCLSMVYLGMDSTDRLLHEIIFHCVDRIPSLRPEQLCLLSEACRRVFDKNIVMSAILMQCQELLNDEMTVVAPDRLAALSRSLVNCRRLCSLDLWQNACDKVLKLLGNTEIDISVECLSDLINFGHKTLYGVFVNKMRAYQILRGVGERVLKKIDECDPSHIGTIHMVWNTDPEFTKESRNVFQARAIELSSETTKLSDVINLFLAIQPNTPLQIRRNFESKLFAGLTDADSVTLGTLARVLYRPQAWNPDIMYRFQYLTLQRIDELFHNSFSFSHVFRLLSSYPHADRSLQFMLVRALERLIEETNVQFFDKLVISYTARYVFPLSEYSLNTKLLLAVIQGIPHWNMTTLLPIMLGLNRMQQGHDTVMRNQIARIYHTLHKRVMGKFDITHSLQLYHLCLGLIKNSNYRDPLLTSQLLEMFSFFSPNMSTEIPPVVRLFRTVRYHLPKVYDDFVSHVIDYPVDDVNRAALVLSACSRVGYIPNRINEFTTVLSNFIKDDIMNPARVRLVVTVLSNLAQIQQFPEEELSQVFTVEFIEHIDKVLGKSTLKYRQSVEYQMMLLNRSVCLECPQLGVPWFHDQYCAEKLVTSESQGERKRSKQHLRNDIETCLLEVLGGDRYMRRWCYSPYYHEIDFECLLDGNDQPVVMGGKPVPDGGDQHRVAILTHSDDNFCYNSEIPNGRTQMNIRHLEILQYKVVQIPHFEWYSMGLTDWDAKKDYLAEKIFH